MLRVPLKTRILLITVSGDYICKVMYAGNDTLDIMDVFKRNYNQEWNPPFKDIPVSRRLIIDRSSVTGYSTLENLFNFTLNKENLFLLSDRKKLKENN